MLSKKVIMATMTAAIVMGMIQMIYEAVAGLGFWSPVVLIAATVMRSLQQVGAHVPVAAMPVILGLMGHMINSMILGMIFAMIARGGQSRISLTMLGMVYGIIVFAVMWFLIVPLIDPIMKELNAVAFVVAHLMWGAVLGYMIGAPSDQTTATA